MGRTKAFSKRKSRVWTPILSIFIRLFNKKIYQKPTYFRKRIGHSVQNFQALRLSYAYTLFSLFSQVWLTDWARQLISSYLRLFFSIQYQVISYSFKQLDQIFPNLAIKFASYFPLFENRDSSSRQKSVDSQFVKNCKLLKQTEINQ